MKLTLHQISHKYHPDILILIHSRTFYDLFEFMTAILSFKEGIGEKQTIIDWSSLNR